VTLRLRVRWLGTWLTICSVSLVPLAFANKAKPQEELQELRGRIETLQKQLSEKEGSRSEAADALRESEKAISEVNRRLHDLSADQRVAESQADAVKGQIKALEERVVGERLRIAKILRHRYMEGGRDALKIILSGQNPARAARQLHYYTYISRARIDLIQQVNSHLVRLGELELESKKKADEVHLLKEQESGVKKQLVIEQVKRKQLLSQLSVQIAGQRKEIDRLKQNEQRLTQLIKEINLMLAKKRAEDEYKAKKKSSKKPSKKEFNNEVPDDSIAGKSFASLRGKLKLPVRGELTNRFGSPREAGGPSWKGLLINAEAGQAVRAIADGRVVFADWLRGFGNMVILDHGGGYMSLYGHNDSLLKSVGEVIKGGESIAVVGNTGGNFDSGVYFELRYQSKPLDPLSWVAR
jgi:murein hydrolase activator